MIKVTKTGLFTDSPSVRSACETLSRNALRDVGLTCPWMTALWESHFSTEDSDACLVQGPEGTGGIVPFYLKRQRMHGIPVNVLHPIGGLYSTSGGMPFTGSPDRVWGPLLEFSCGHWKWDLFECCLEDDSQMAAALRRTAVDMGSHLTEAFCDSAPFLTLSGTPEDFLAGKSGNFRSNLKRKRKKLEKKGRLTFECITEPNRADDAMRAVIDVENNSWKAAAGSAINSSRRREFFYRLLAQRCGHRGWLRIYLLRLDEKPIAFDFGLLFQRRYFMLKTSYRDEYKHLSPGVVLRWLVVHDLFASRAREHDFMWGEEPYKLQWANGSRRYCLFQLHGRSIPARLGHYAGKFRKLFKTAITGPDRSDSTTSSRGTH